ncbi:toll/interleukin-1 receptor domain-containing protein [Pseudonocardia alni]|uniref:toll/interleukin-1 receptor domain-containing protein n=1 Tax=Pseudonocardia alni TaxID=33907 RepID=UPI00333488BB
MAMTPGADQAPIRCFLSYVHSDDAVLGVVEDFKHSLESFAHSDRGRRLEVFLDRQSIGWGDDWQEEIREGVSGAMVFMPLLTRRYFESVACREELLAFYNGADELAATDLLLPVVILGKSFIRIDSDDFVVHVVASRQYRDLQNAVIAGPGTAEWRRALIDLANDLVDAVERIEAKFEPVPHDSMSVTPTGDEADGGAAAELPDDAPGLLDLDETLGRKLMDIHDGFEEMTEILDELNTVFVEGSARIQQSSASKGPNNPAILRFAQEAKPVAERFEAVGTRMERTASAADGEFRQLCDLLSSPGTEELREKMAESIAGAEGFQATLNAIDEFLPTLRPLEVTSAGIRRSLKPMRKGTNSVRTAVAIIRAWPGLIEGANGAAA